MFKSLLEADFNYDDMLINFKQNTKCAQATEQRTLEAIRPSLLDSNCTGPEIVYAINMDVYQSEDFQDLKTRNQLYGLVVYNKGLIGQEAVRSQGHLHAISSSCGERTGEVYQIWQGSAFICMQYEEAGITKFYAVKAEAGDIVLVRNDYLHYTVNADPTTSLVFGAWCIRDYAFEYSAVRSKQGLAYYPIFKKGEIEWQKNKNYDLTKIIVKKPENYKEFGLEQGLCIYKQYKQKKDAFEFLTKPSQYKNLWQNYIP